MDLITHLHTREASMDLKQLKAFVTVAETGSVTSAARLLNIVQPAVSRQLKLLEDDIGAPLFTRGRLGMELTDAGKTLEDYARRALNELDRARAEIRPSSGTVGGIVTVGLLPSTADMLSSALLSAVTAHYPGIRLRLTAGYAGHLQSWLETGDVDFALLYDSKPNPALKFRPLLEESLWFVGPPASGLDKHNPVRMADIIGRPLVLPSAPHGLRSLVEQAARAQETDLHIVAETNAMSVQKRLVLDGHGYTILPSIAVADDVDRGILAAAPVVDPLLVRRIVLAQPATRAVANSVHCVMNELIQCARDAVRQDRWPSAQWLAK
ncbi:MAG: LysR substrate-binding domain-containing protein [Achromobacter kerstersii]